ncbi:unnamed protein product [Caenorhabditis bovis]|uniref:L-Fucosyltransferase n=1 Tax=Caenorhabditis bovis TaxID=2654633 RepID=A0A8S1EJ61_9PELO|nr:unnamed protein product [Caenorhabditis bovis]
MMLTRRLFYTLLLFTYFLALTGIVWFSKKTRTIHERMATTRQESPTLRIFMYGTKYGQMGNVFFELAALLGIADTLGRVPVIDSNDLLAWDALYDYTGNRFPRLLEQFNALHVPKDDLKMVNITEFCCVYGKTHELKNETARHLMIRGIHFQSFKYFDHMRSEIRSIFQPSTPLFQFSEKLLPNEYKNDFIICPHIRRGDFETSSYHNPSSAEFTLKATEFLIKKYLKTHPKITVMVFGNDHIWSTETFSEISEYNIFISKGMSVAVDIAFASSYCDVVLITAPSSTFGWWLGYLAKENAVVYYRDISEAGDKMKAHMIEEDYYPPSWKKLKSDGTIFIRLVKNMKKLSTRLRTIPDSVAKE